MQQSLAIVIDNGSHSVKAGFAFDDAPRAVFPSVLGRPKSNGLMVGVSTEDIFIGRAVLEKRGVLRELHPIVRGEIENLPMTELLWYHCFYNQLLATPSSPCLMSCSPLIPALTKEEVTESAFETFLLPGFYLASAPLLSLFASGKTSGLALEVGQGYSCALPAIEGVTLHHAIEKSNFAGQDLNRYLCKLLADRSVAFMSLVEDEYLRTIKHAHCRVAAHFQSEIARLGAEQVTLPDGQLIELGEAKLKCGEALFRPKSMGSDSPGLHEVVVHSIAKCENEQKKELFGNIVLGGGSSLLPGLKPRLQSEVQALSSNYGNIKKRVWEHSQGRFLSWLGGSVVASLQSFQTMWVTKAEFEESGRAVVFRKCF